ncbi:MAG: hypothetical protein GXY89_05265 [Tissierellia bacterium]|jgi:5-bromo-4-chloroindolyl phosphate hydrolysis protein|nr:hypothetical protein [Tissierellia bacterium]
MSKIDIELEEELKKEKLRKDLEDLRRMEREEEIKESLEIIGNSLLSGLASITSVSASAIETAVEKTKEANKVSRINEAEKIRKRLELRQRQKDLQAIQQIKKIRKKKKNKTKAQVGAVVFLTSFFILGLGIFPSVALTIISNLVMDKVIESGFKLPDFLSKKKNQPELTGKQQVKHEDHEEIDEFVQIITNANNQLDKIYDVVENAKDEEIKEQATKLYERGIQILDYLKKHPEKMAKSSRFLSYYLETAAKICEKYLDFSKNKVQSEDIEDVLDSTKRAMILLEKAFDNEFLKLMEDDIIDIETDVKVLENSMKWDNYMD